MSGFLSLGEQTVSPIPTFFYFAHPTSPFYKFFNGNTWADIKRIFKNFVDSILSSPSLFIQSRVTKVDSRNYKNIKPFFCEMILLLFICRKIHSNVFYYAFFDTLLSALSPPSENNTQNNTKSVMFANAGGIV